MAITSPEELKALAKSIEVAKGIEAKLRASLSPLGTFNISKLLDERRIQYGIPDGAFQSYPCFDKCYIWQISIEGGRDTYTEGGTILMPESVKTYKKNTAPRGILVSAGLQAMDSLYSTGIEIGHIIRFKKFSPFIMPVAEIDGHELTVMVVRDGDIEASEDLAAQFNSKSARIHNTSKDGYDFRVYGEVKNGSNVSGRKVSPYYDPSI